MTASAQAVVTTPWYPTQAKPYAGSFVRDWVRALAWAPEDLTVVHLEMVAPNDSRSASRRPTPEGDVVWIPVKVGHSLPRAEAARAQAEAMTGAARDAVEAAEVVFAHVGLPTGFAAAQAVRPGQRLVLVEHASYLPQVLGQAASRALYGQVVSVSDVVFTAGEHAASRIRRTFPADRAKIWAVGNPVDPADFTFLERSGDAPVDRWLYVGNLDAAKGVFAVVAGFAAYVARRRRDGLRLALAGQGAARPQLEALAKRLGVADRVDFLGALDRTGVGGAMAAADLQLHLSPAETFGLAPIEGLLSGLPLVVASNHGTLQTMGPAVAAGRAWLIDPPLAPVRPRRLTEQTRNESIAPALAIGEAVADAVAGLESALRQGAPGAAREVRDQIARRYGPAGFGAMQRRVAAGQAPFAEAVPQTNPQTNSQTNPQTNPLVAVALTENGWDELSGLAGQALFDGRSVTVVVASRSLAEGLDARIEVALRPDPAPWAAPLSRFLGRAAVAPLKIWSLLRRRIGRQAGRAGGDWPPPLVERALGAALRRRRGLEAAIRRQTTPWRRARRFARAVQTVLAERRPTPEVRRPPSEGCLAVDLL
ncbi:MAG: glycosyltransferase [Bifidobacteriaceae bacterium]|nr:glycosyltransferase [Bifidobacteriaceae bacterium]